MNAQICASRPTYSREFLLKLRNTELAFKSPKWLCAPEYVSLVRKSYRDFSRLKTSLDGKQLDAGNVSQRKNLVHPFIDDSGLWRKKSTPPRSYEKPKCLRQRSGGDSEVIRAVKLLLNKLTPTTFDSLVQKFSSIDISICLLEVVRLFVRKASEDRSYVHMYARLCRSLGKTNEKMNDDLKEALGKACAEEFYKTSSTADELAAAKAQEGHVFANREKIILLQEKLDKEKRQKTGAALFTSSLYNEGLFGGNIIKARLTDLLASRDELALDNFCAMVFMCGKKLSASTKVYSQLSAMVKNFESVVTTGSYGKRMVFKTMELLKFVEEGCSGESPYDPQKRMTTTTRDQIKAMVEKEKEEGERCNTHHRRGFQQSSPRLFPKTAQAKKNLPERSRQEAAPEITLGDDAIREKVSEILNDALSKDSDPEEVVAKLTELPKMQRVVFHSINGFLENSDASRQLIKSILDKMYADDRVSREDFTEGFKDILDYVDDYLVDMPRFWEYFWAISKSVLLKSKVPPQITFQLRTKVLSPNVRIAGTIIRCLSGKRA